MMLIDLTGKSFGKLTVLKRDTSCKGSRVKWVCQCDCGNVKTVTGRNLTSGDTNSCGCLAKKALIDRNVTHGLSRIPEYGIWQTMINRCHNHKVKNYCNYGGRGIVVCDRWKDSFENFINDMGYRPSPSCSIDRINTNGNYEPGNCRWATVIDQANNRNNNVVGTYRGRNMTISELARATNISVYALRSRVIRDGLSFDEAVARGSGVKRYEFNGENLSLPEWAKKLSIPYKVLHARIRIKKWSLEKSFK